MKLSSKFQHVLWHYTLSDENLFKMSDDDLYTYVILIKEVLKNGAV